MAGTYSIALAGMRNAEFRLERSARAPAQSLSPSAPARSAGETGSVQLSTIPAPSATPAGQMVTILETRIAFKSNLKAVAAGHELDRHLLDMIG